MNQGAHMDQLSNNIKGPLIHIGYHKTGSSWLQQLFFNNPLFGFLSPFEREKEIGEYLIYHNSLDFSIEDCKNYFIPGINKAIGDGLIPVISYERLSGNPHSGGYDSKEVANRLAQVFPTAKVLIVIREQKSMILSIYKQYVIDGGACSLDRYLYPPSCGKGRIPLFSFDHFKYHRLIECYIDLFGKSNILVLPYEILKDNPSQFLASIIKFCGITVDPDIITKSASSTPINVGFSGFSIAMKRRINFLFASDHINPCPIFPSPRIENQFGWWLKKWSPLIPKRIHSNFDKKLKKGVVEMVGHKYRSSNRLTAGLFDINLEKYKYDL